MQRQRGQKVRMVVDAREWDGGMVGRDGEAEGGSYHFQMVAEHGSDPCLQETVRRKSLEEKWTRRNLERVEGVP